MRDYCEEEMWTWVFPHHKCQKILSKSRGEAEWFGRNFLARVVRRNPCSHFRSHSNHIVENYKQKQNIFFWSNSADYCGGCLTSFFLFSADFLFRAHCASCARTQSMKKFVKWPHHRFKLRALHAHWTRNKKSAKNKKTCQTTTKYTKCSVMFFTRT